MSSRPIVICEGEAIVRLLSQRFFTRTPMNIRFVSVLSRAPRASPRLPVKFPRRGRWLVNVLAREDGSSSACTAAT